MSVPGAVNGFFKPKEDRISHQLQAYSKYWKPNRISKAEKPSNVTRIKMALSNDADKAMIFVNVEDPGDPTLPFVRSHVYAKPCYYSYEFESMQASLLSRRIAVCLSRFERDLPPLPHCHPRPLVSMRRAQRRPLQPALCWRPWKQLLSSNPFSLPASSADGPTHTLASPTAKNLAAGSLLEATKTAALMKCIFCSCVKRGWSLITHREYPPSSHLQAVC